MRYYKLLNGNHVLSTTWFGGLIHVDGIGFLDTVVKFTRISIHHIIWQIKDRYENLRHP